MGRSPCCDESGMKKGPWTPEEDKKLVNHIQTHGHGSWRALPKLAGLNRCGKSCRLRWTNYLRPDIKRGKFSQDEEQTILHLHSILGNKWSAIATHLPGRTDNEIKNFWNTHLKKKLIQMGFDPMTHQPRTDIFSSLPHLIALANLNELMVHHSWEELASKLQSEAVQMASLQYYMQYLVQPGQTHCPANNNIVNMNNNSPTDHRHHHQLPEMVQQVPCTFQEPPVPLVEKDMYVFGQDENNCLVPNVSSSSCFPSLSSFDLPPLMEEATSISPEANFGYTCSTDSSFGGEANYDNVIDPSFWHKLLLEDYPLLQESEL